MLLARLGAQPLRATDAAVGEITRLCGHLPLAIGMLAGQLRQSVSHGTAYVHNEDIIPEEISFMVYRQAANDSWFFGWHSGAITVTTSSSSTTSRTLSSKAATSSS